MLLRSMNISRRAGLSFALIALLAVALGTFSLLEMRRMNEQSLEVDRNWLPSIVAANAMALTSTQIRTLTLRQLVVRDRSDVEALLDRINQLEEQLSAQQLVYEKLSIAPEEKAAYARYLGVKALYLKDQQRVLDLARQGRKDEAIAIVDGGPFLANADAMLKELLTVVEVNTHGGEAAAARSNEVFHSAVGLVLAILAIVLVLTVGLAIVLTRSIVRPLGQAVEVAETIASGDLCHAISVTGNDEPARLLHALQRMQNSLRGTLQKIADSSSQLASAAEELHAVTEDSSKTLHQQSNELEQAATAVNEMTAAVEEVARNAVSTSEASRETDATAHHGRQQVQHTVDSIGDLADEVTRTCEQVEHLAVDVRNIGQVLEVIRSIAEQTNLLALNAAIEAARAGDAGRGFAVVADEVRALAHRTQQSTQEIESMINTIEEGTEGAVSAMRHSNERAHLTLEAARASGLALDQITQAITSINERNLVIASASEEQAQVAREVDRNLVNIRDLATQTSAGANQSNAASQDLSRLAVELNGLVTQFKV
ncbi:methyl-accepting chemotaxis protein [Pseudomonas chlororaphis]|uniref:Methyl-accepting chemotaxis sensor/transducer protein n=1 Tax=Pseudomonas chlororaphis subsp. aureofaciens TaxID=587851 RepID=A0AAD0ZGK6_9PSED|nr:MULTISPECIES: methyl-accepting chemotaxis protein [Pseudomonas]AZD85329.1 Methyl-accepting chemotaxis sensor/transducer protein [Pseudomonas chlororaphis subsp. aureofaciens]AZD91774.1 Methyl-accepting chemotaxis sensor/transducer protein [Pseudomonas chlororaphis subsp. aureofaciens]AZD98262.1 Methyl-accepting chemotaxis sensor/transducer protein [Pseudomonas chlororaphis subsp. aureofaciens]AZE04486.1 Methyl-accepting chemotaxis sensor/transducer protein [Pseudomonas chlororaphis subsp. au